MQKPIKNRITEILTNDKSVNGLVLIGSYARSDVVSDTWSDLDLAVIVDDESAGHYYPATDWITQFGDLYASQSSSTDYFNVIRAQYTDGQCVDFVIIAESSLESIDQWPRNPLQFENRCIFSRSSLLNSVLNMTYPERKLQKYTAEQIKQIANENLFKGMLATTKAARNELLVALHLGLDMVRDCLVLAMMIRDQETGTDHHRDESKGNHLVELLGTPMKEYTALEVISSIERSAIAFESLAIQLDDEYVDRRKPLLDYIARVRSSLLEDDSINNKQHLDSKGM